uniref:Zinc finger MYM-type protein 1 n=1 Tax=Cacopsylla melanoneura TaxID=428564 RepID=A0A8D8THQ5_9HEMI
MFRNHETNGYHKKASLDALNFVAVHEKKKLSIHIELDTAKQELIEKNRKILHSIIETIIFIGRQEIACRGHVDSGPILIDPDHNDGNFRSLLRFRVSSGDKILSDHLFKNQDSSNARYTSPQIQNEIIEICGNIIKDKVVSKINSSNCFSILADETMDISGTEQFSLCARYLETTGDKGTVLKEDFLTFVPVEDLSGEGLSKTLLTTCEKLQLNLNLMIGQGYDGASSMSGKLQGCSTRITEKFPQALYIHCASHSLNLAIGDACNISSIRNTIGTVKEIINFFRPSGKRESILKKKIEELGSTSKKQRLMRLCETRWTERLDALISFKELFCPIFFALEEIAEHGDGDTSRNAFALMNSLKSSEFIISLTVVQEIFSCSHNIATALQNPHIDLSSAIEMTSGLSNILKNKREDSNSFQTLYVLAQNLAQEIEVEIKKPRTAKIQRNRSNYDVDNVEDYYRISIFNPFLDHFISQLDLRFLKHKHVLSKIENILPSRITSINQSGIEETVKILCEQWQRGDAIEILIVKELELWQEYWRTTAITAPTSFIDSIDCCSSTLFPNIRNYLEIGAVLPVTTASVERSFSTLKRLKTYLRNSTGQIRLNGLALLSVHRDVPLTTEEVLESFSLKQRKIILR